MRGVAAPGKFQAVSQRAIGAAQCIVEQAAISGHGFVAHVALHLGGAAPGSHVGGGGLPEDRGRDGAVEVGDEGLEVAAGAARALDDLDLLALRQDGTDAGGEGLHQVQQIGLLLGAGVPRIGALDAGRAEPLERDRPELEPVALEPDRPEAPAR